MELSQFWAVKSADEWLFGPETEFGVLEEGEFCVKHLVSWPGRL